MEYYINEPYPSIDNLDMNIAYGQILLSNIGGLQCEMNAVSLYFYNNFGLNYHKLCIRLVLLKCII